MVWKSKTVTQYIKRMMGENPKISSTNAGECFKNPIPFNCILKKQIENERKSSTK